MRIAVATLSKSFLLFRRLLGEKIGSVKPPSERFLDRRRVFLNDVIISPQDTHHWCVSCGTLKFILHLERESALLPSLPSTEWSLKVPRRRWTCRQKRYEDDLKLIDVLENARAKLWRTIDGRRRWIPRLRSEYLLSTAKAVLPYLADEQEEKVEESNRKGNFLEVCDRKKKRITPHGVSRTTTL